MTYLGQWEEIKFFRGLIIKKNEIIWFYTVNISKEGNEVLDSTVWRKHWYNFPLIFMF